MEESKTVEYNLSSVIIKIVSSYSGRTFAFTSDQIKFEMPVVKVGCVKRDAILHIEVGEGTLKAAKEMEELQHNSLGIEKSFMRKLRGD